MTDKLIKVLSSKKTQGAILCLVLVILFSFGAVKPVEAFGFGDIGRSIANGILSVVGFVFGILFNIYGTVTGAFFGVAVLIFNWVSSDNFISLSYTNAGLDPLDPNYNHFVGTGWALTRDLANIIFIIAFIVIGIATSLRISGYQASQTLKNLIIIALLVNFTPVICGLIIDASNILTYFFINPEGSSAGQAMYQRSLGVWQDTLSLTGGSFWDPSKQIAAAIASLFQIFFNILAGVIYLLFAVIFIFRYVALWLLVVLSPIAFACYILPRTRGVWSQWWKTFMQWCLVGVVAGFFLYLSEHLYLTTNSAIFEQMTDNSQTNGLALVINGILPSVMPIVLLFVGFTMSITGIPGAANAVLSAGKTGLKTAGVAAGSYIGTRAGARAWQTARKAPKVAWQGARHPITTLKTAERKTKPYTKPMRKAASGVAKVVQDPRKITGVKDAGGEVLQAWRDNKSQGIKKGLGAAAETIRQKTGTDEIKVRATARKIADKVKSDAKGFKEGLSKKGPTKSIPAQEGLASALGQSLKAGWGAAWKSKASKEKVKCKSANCNKEVEVGQHFCECGYKQD